MEWITNCVHPEQVTIVDVCPRGNETPWQALKRWKEWSSQFKIGEPKATKKYSVSDLKKVGLVGLYRES